MGCCTSHSAANPPANPPVDLPISHSQATTEAITEATPDPTTEATTEPIFTPIIRYPIRDGQISLHVVSDNNFYLEWRTEHETKRRNFIGTQPSLAEPFYGQVGLSFMRNQQYYHQNILSHSLTNI